MPYSIQDAVLIGLTTLGLTASDTVNINASNIRPQNNITLSRTFTAPASGAIPLNKLMTVTGDPAGSDVRMQRDIITGEGPHGFKDLRNRYAGTNFNGPPGANSHLGYTDHLYMSVTGGGTLNVGRVSYAHGVVSNGSHVNELRLYDAGDSIIHASGGTMGDVVGFRVSGIGHPTNVARAVGLRVVDFSASQYAIGAQISTKAGPGKMAILVDGDAPSAIVGKVKVGSRAVPQHAMDVVGDAQVTGAYRFANGLTITSGPGMPSFPAAKGSLHLSTDFGMVQNIDGNMGWVRK